MSRPVHATLDLSALAHNHEVTRHLVGKAKIWSVVKANAYGHGLIRTAETLAPLTDGLALVEFDGAVALRSSGFKLPILMLEGFYGADDLKICAELGLTTVVHSMAQVRALVAAKLTKPIDVLVKLNTGMNRLGFEPVEFPQALKLLQKVSSVGSITLMTHFPNADGPGGVQDSLKIFRGVNREQGLARCLANSAAILRHPKAHGNWVRPGIMLYGGSPFADATAASFDLKPVMSLHSRILACRNLKTGDAVGYGGTFVAPKNMRIGVVACGYGDGYPRHAPTGTPIIVGGVVTRTIGLVSMDKICVDLDTVTHAEVGTPVLLWGTDGKVTLPADEVAAAAETLSYELFCALARRVPVQEIGG